MAGEPVTTRPGGEPASDRYDVIVVGAGLGGLSAAACLAKAGRKTLVLDQQDGPGGLAKAFQRGPYRIDPAVHVSAEARDGRFLDNLLRHLGVRDLCTLLPVEPASASSFPGARFDAPVGVDGFLEFFARRFPRHAGEFRDYLTFCSSFVTQAQQVATEVSWQNLDDAVERFPLLFQYRSATVAEVLDEHLTDPHMKAVWAAAWPYQGLPPSRLSFFAYTGLMLTFIQTGATYCRGGFEVLADAFVAALERAGGEFVPDTRVAGIDVKDGGVTGVRLADGRRVEAGIVVSNVDARQTFVELVGPAALPPAYLRRLERLRPSLSTLSLYVATDLDVRAAGASFATFVYDHWDHDETYREILAGLPGGVWVTIPTLLDDTVAPAGEHLIVMLAMIEHDAPLGDGDKARHTSTLLRLLDRIVPGIEGHIRFLEMATPRSLERRISLTNGATYGWENSPEQSASGRLSHETPIRGLYLSGHWTRPGSSSFKVMVSGVEASQLITGSNQLRDLLPGLARIL